MKKYIELTLKPTDAWRGYNSSVLLVEYTLFAGTERVAWFGYAELRPTLDEMKDKVRENEEWAIYADGLKQKHPVFTGEYVIEYDDLREE